MAEWSLASLSDNVNHYTVNKYSPFVLPLPSESYAWGRDKNKAHFLHKSTLFSGHVLVYIGCHLVVLKCAVRNTLKKCTDLSLKT